MRRRPRTRPHARARDVNTTLQDRLLQRALLQDRYANAADQAVQGLLTQTLTGVLSLVHNAGLFTTERLPGTFGLLLPGKREALDRLMLQIAGQVGRFVQGSVQVLSRDLPALATLELYQLPRVVQDVLDAALPQKLREAEGDDDAAALGTENLFARPTPLPLLFRSVPLGHITELLGTPLGGAFYATSFADLGAVLVAAIRNILLAGLVSGEGIAPVARKLQQVMGGARYKAERIVRSEFVRVANQAALTTYAQNADVIQAVQWVSTLDDATCLQCAQLDGRTWEAFTAAPLPVADTHPNCRCRLVPVVKDAESLGLPPGTRASFSGQVPETLTYPEWFRQQSADFKRKVLGPTRYKLYASGRARLKDFATASGIRPIRDVVRTLGEAEAATVEAPGISQGDYGDTCRWITKAGRRICITAGHAHRTPPPSSAALRQGFFPFATGAMPNNPADQERQAFLDNLRKEGIEAVGALWEDMKDKGGELEVPGDTWATLSDDAKSEIQQQWENDHYSEFLEKAEEEWRNDTAGSEIEHEIRTDTDWQREALSNALQNEAEFTPDQATEVLDRLEERALRIATVEFAVDDLVDEEQVGAEAAGRIEAHRKAIRDSLRSQYEDEYNNRMQNAEVPDSIKDEALDAVSEAFNSLSVDELDQMASDYGSGGRSIDIAEPDRWIVDSRVAEDLRGGDTAYRTTGAIGKALVEARTKQLWADLGHHDDINLDFDHYWNAWKSDSYDPGALGLHAAAVTALGANTRGVEIEKALKYGRANPYESPNLEKTEVYVRALWDTTQFLMMKAGQTDLTIYRAVTLANDKLAAATKVPVTLGSQPYRDEFVRLPDVPLQQNAAQSSTLKESVANSWGGISGSSPRDGSRVVVRARVPSTAVLSLPVYGQNVHDEAEAVILGTPWLKWDAWLKRAPLPEKVAIESLAEALARPPRRRGTGLITQDGSRPDPKAPLIIDFADPDQVGDKHWLTYGAFEGRTQQEASGDDCVWRTIDGHPVCIRSGHRHTPEPTHRGPGPVLEGETIDTFDAKSLFKGPFYRGSHGSVANGVTIGRSRGLDLQGRGVYLISADYPYALRDAAQYGEVSEYRVDVRKPLNLYGPEAKAYADSEAGRAMRETAGSIGNWETQYAAVVQALAQRDGYDAFYYKPDEGGTVLIVFDARKVGVVKRSGTTIVPIPADAPRHPDLLDEASSDDCIWRTLPGRGPVCITAGHSHGREGVSRALGGTLPQASRFLTDHGWQYQSASLAAEKRHQHVVYHDPESGDTVTVFANGDWVHERSDGTSKQGRTLLGLKAHLVKEEILPSFKGRPPLSLVRGVMDTGMLEGKSSQPMARAAGWDPECRWRTIPGRGPICITEFHREHGREGTAAALPQRDSVPVDDLKEVRLAGMKVWSGTIRRGREILVYRGIGDLKELEDAVDDGAWESKGNWVVSSWEGRTQTALNPVEIAFHTGTRHLGPDVQSYPYLVQVDVQGLQVLATDTSKWPKADQSTIIDVKGKRIIGGDTGLGLGINEPIPLSRIKGIWAVDPKTLKLTSLKDQFLDVRLDLREATDDCVWRTLPGRGPVCITSGHGRHAEGAPIWGKPTEGQYTVRYGDRVYRIYFDQGSAQWRETRLLMKGGGTPVDFVGFSKEDVNRAITSGELDRKLARFDVPPEVWSGPFDFSNPGGPGLTGAHARETKIGDSTLIYGVGANQTAELISLRTPASKRGQGSAARALTQFLAATDARGLTVTLNASPLDKKTSRGRLIAFYQKHGFELTGETINPAGDPTMIRRPRAVAQEARDDCRWVTLKDGRRICIQDRHGRHQPTEAPPSIFPPTETWGKRSSATDRLEMANDIAARHDLPTHQVRVYEGDGPVRKFGDWEFREGGHFNPATMEIVLFSDDHTQFQMMAMAEHEVGHYRWLTFQMEVAREQADFNAYVRAEGPDNPFVAAGVRARERQFLVDPVATDYLKPEAKERWPALYARSRFYAALDAGTFTDNDVVLFGKSVSSYAKEWWERVEKGEVSVESAVNETLAEIKRRLATDWDGKWPRMIDVGNTIYMGVRVGAGRAYWEQLYSAVQAATLRRGARDRG